MAAKNKKPQPTPADNLQEALAMARMPSTFTITCDRFGGGTYEIEVRDVVKRPAKKRGRRRAK